MKLAVSIICLLGLSFSLLAGSGIENNYPKKGSEKGIEFFHGTFEEALAQAKKEGKLIFVDAYASWCGPCKLMARNTFTNAEVGEFYNTNFINVKMDMEKGEGPTYAPKWGIRAYPTLLYFNAEGKVVHNTMGYHKPGQFLQVGKDALERQP